MSENKKIKVFRKIKVNKATPAPIKLEPEKEDVVLPAAEQPEDDFIFETPHSSEEDKVAEKLKDQEEDDEFEKLLNQFINSELEDFNTDFEETDIKETEALTSFPSQPTQSDSPSANKPLLHEGEKALLEAYKNFTNSITIMAGMKELEIPNFTVESSDLFPHYRPRVGSKIAEDTIKGWDIMIKAQPNRLLGIKPDASDEELLDFAEKTTDEILQLTIISYVEILIEIEGCEITYEEKRLLSQRRKIEREIYDEHQRHIERKQNYIALIEKKKFPIDATRLINNYFKTAQKDPEGAYKVLVNNPAVYAPINNSKIQPRFFGLIKVTPQDGIRINREIGDFLKKVKV